jgi:DNA (cytosine-5)-methyltransferase 1
VDIEPHDDYPFEFINADALEILARGSNLFAGIDAVHASPPCQSFTAYRRRGNGVGDGYPDLIAPIRRELQSLDVPYVIENVPGAPLENPVQLCGSSFGLDVRRHRLFESSVSLTGKPCNHSWQTPRFPPASNRKNMRRTVEVGVWRIPLKVQQKAMGIDWMKLPDLTEAIPPAYTEFIGRQLMQYVTESAA